MPERVPFADEPGARDALTFVRRAERLGDGTVRLRGSGGTLAMTVAPLAPQSLLDPTPTVLGMRVAAIDPEIECDVVVEAGLLTVVGTDLVLPDTGVSAAWAGISPPRGGWTPIGTLAASTLATRAQWGIATIAEALPADPGTEIVTQVRAEVWGADDDALDGIARGAAFAAFALGFIAGDEPAIVRRSGAWTRVTLARGHVLVRRAVRAGLTAVRTTGPAPA